MLQRNGLFVTDSVTDKPICVKECFKLQENDYICGNKFGNELMEQPKVERILRMMKMLTGNVEYTVDDLAERLNFNRRSVYRYLETLENAGFVIQKSRKGVKLCTESPFFKDISQLIHFSQEEAYMVNQLIESIADTNVVKCNLKKKLASVYHFRGVAESIVDKEHNTSIHTLLDAIERKRMVVLKNYASAHAGEVRDRLVEPFAFTSNYVQVWCYELATGMNKMFKVSRIEEVQMMDEAWIGEEKHQTAYLDIFRISASGYETHPVKLELNTRSRNLLVEEYPLSEKFLTKLGDGKWLLDTMVSGYAGVGRFVMGLAADVRIIDSPGLEEYVKQYVRKHVLDEKGGED